MPVQDDDSGTAFSSTDQAKLQLAAVYHQSARAEIIQRITNRDQALFLYIAAAATIFGVALADKGSRAPLLLVIPFLGLGVAAIHAQHNTVIGAIGEYLGSELSPVVQDILHGRGPAPVDWDSSEVLVAGRSIVRLRTLSGLALVTLPELAAQRAQRGRLDRLLRLPDRHAYRPRAGSKGASESIQAHPGVGRSSAL
jgi:hypothetical protein